jgi:hypothetical protein
MLDFLKSASTPPNDLLGIVPIRAGALARSAGGEGSRSPARGERRRLLPARVPDAVVAVYAHLDSVGAGRASPPRLPASFYFFLVKPLRRRVTDDQVALYLEEKEPSLQTMLISAVESSREGRHWESSALVEKLVAQAVEKCCQADTARRAEHGPLRANGAIFTGSLPLQSSRCCSPGIFPSRAVGDGHRNRASKPPRRTRFL